MRRNKMALGTLERALEVNPFAKPIEVDKMPEHTEDATVEISEKVNSVFKKYKNAYSLLKDNTSFGSDYISRLDLELLLPVEIDLVLQLIINTHIQEIYSRTAGFIVSRLIKDSYKAGNNNFQLTTNDYPICSLFNTVYGTKKNPVIATVNGNAGDCFARFSEYCIFEINGNAGEAFGYKSKYCTYNLFGNAGACVGMDSTDSTYDMHGDVGKLIGGDSNCTYNIRGKIESPVSNRIKNSTFKVLNNGNYDLLIKNLPKTNTIQLLDKSGRTIMETRK